MTNNHPELIYKVTITEMDYEDFEDATLIYEQIVESLDVKAVIDAVNGTSAKTPRATRSDKGKKRNQESAPAQA